MEATGFDTLFGVLKIIAAFVVIGAVLGLAIGRSIVKRSKPGYKPLLSRQETIVYALCAVLGVASIVFGVTFKLPPAGDNSTMQSGFAEGGEYMNGGDGDDAAAQTAGGAEVIVNAEPDAAVMIK